MLVIRQSDRSWLCTLRRLLWIIGKRLLRLTIVYRCQAVGLVLLLSDTRPGPLLSGAVSQSCLSGSLTTPRFPFCVGRCECQARGCSHRHLSVAVRQSVLSCCCQTIMLVRQSDSRWLCMLCRLSRMLGKRVLRSTNFWTTPPRRRTKPDRLVIDYSSITHPSVTLSPYQSSIPHQCQNKLQLLNNHVIIISASVLSLGRTVWRLLSQYLCQTQMYHQSKWTHHQQNKLFAFSF